MSAATGARAGPAPTLTRLLLVRHGETDWNALRRIQGQIDIDLNETGEQQARSAAQWLSRAAVDAIHSSDLLRAWRTAEPIGLALSLPVTPEVHLRERHWGLFQGMRFADIAHEHPADHARLAAREPGFDAHGGESLLQLMARTEAALRRIVASRPGCTIVVVSHGGLIDCAYRLANGRDLSSPRDFTLNNAAINELFVHGDPDSGRFSMGRWGIDTSHGDGLDELP